MPLRDVEPHAQGSVEHAGDYVRLLAAHIREHGLREPLELIRTADETWLHDGHHRLAAARLAGLTHVRVVVRSRPRPPVEPDMRWAGEPA